jgi:hypothetical protein
VGRAQVKGLSFVNIFFGMTFNHKVILGLKRRLYQINVVSIHYENFSEFFIVVVIK